jgi:uncharacterized membrane protein
MSEICIWLMPLSIFVLFLFFIMLGVLAAINKIKNTNYNIPHTKTIVIVLLAILGLSSAGLIMESPVENNEQEQNTTSKWTQEDIKQANDYIITLEAAGLVKERKDTCSDGSKGCYYFIIDENLWNNAANYETKQQLLTASEIYASSQTPYKFFEGKGYMSGKKLYDIWGIK